MSYELKARITDLEAELKLAAQDMQRATEETAKILVAKGAEIQALVAMLRTMTAHLETANEILLAEGVIDEEEDYADEKSIIEEARALLDKYARAKFEAALEEGPDAAEAAKEG